MTVSRLLWSYTERIDSKMTTNKLVRIALIVLSITLLLGVGLSIALLVPREENIIRVDLENGEDTLIEFKQLSLTPGAECSYTLLLSTETDDEFDITFTFTETDDSPLKEYVYVKITDGEETIYELLLSDLLDGESLHMTRRLEKREAHPIVITYYLPQDVGNEAQDAEAVFDLHISASNE